MITNEYGLAERQYELLSVLKDFDKIMTENEIQYSLCGGTLLGAIRHHGFIPWDDDLDIMCDRDNYNRILELFAHNNGVISVTREGDDFSKIRYSLNRILWIDRFQKADDSREGLTAATIDIFVMDRCPDNILVRKCKVLMIKILQGMMHKTINTEGLSTGMKACLLATHAFGKLFTDRFKERLYMSISQIGNGKNTQYITGYNDSFNLLNCLYSGRLMNSMIRLPFEDVELPVTDEYDNYLTTQYGDYMTPPDMSERIPEHVEPLIKNGSD